MIITGCCPTRRHVSRTHRVALDWLFDRINLDPKNQIRYIDTKHQLADILTKGSFTRDEWNNLLDLFNVSQRFCQVFSDLLVLKHVQQETTPFSVTRSVCQYFATVTSFDPVSDCTPAAVVTEMDEDNAFTEAHESLRVLFSHRERHSIEMNASDPVREDGAAGTTVPCLVATAQGGWYAG